MKKMFSFKSNCKNKEKRINSEKTLFGILKKIKLIIALVIILLVSIISYSFVDNDFEVAKNLDVFATLYRQVNLNYVDDTKPGELIKTAIDGMLEHLDPYTNYIPESELEDYKFMTTGEYGGIGALIHKQNDYIVISDPYEGFPAQKADLRAGDIILEINGNSAKGKSSGDISNLLKGQPGTSVKLLIKRPGVAKSFEVNINREEVKIDNIPYFTALDNNVGYIRLSSFTQDAGKEVKNAFVALKEKNNIKSLILDLRGNGGGLLNEAVNITNLFVDKGELVVSTKGKLTDRNANYRTLNPPIDINIPLVVLVDKGSASASEIVTGAIQDLDRGVIMGQRTFGKGLVQNVVPLSYNAKLKVTIAKYYIPSGRCIQAIDYSHRNEDGSVGKIADSLITAFKTRKGRLVYDGGGIKPDVSLDSQLYSNVSASLITKFLIFDFATQFKNKNNSISEVKNFSITDSIFNDFVSFLSDKDWDYTTNSEANLKKLKESAEAEKYFDDIKTEYENLKTKMMHNKKEDLLKYKDEIKELLKEEIVSRYYYQKGRIEASLETDTEIKKAIELLNDKDKYSKILAGS